MSNSPLVSYTNISPNKNSPRNSAIDRITPHCVVGQLSAESICGCFTSPSRQASCNYGIGTDGRVSLCVEEKDRSWCSSSGANDHRAVTIECASDKTAPYAMSEKVYASLINLCTDICKRNGKNRLLWLGDKGKTLAYNPAPGEMVITVHRWFANKSCPGDWLYSRLGDLAAQVTARLNTGSTSADTGSTEGKIWNFLKSKGLNDYAVAGIMGNLKAESNFSPINLQNGYEKKFGMNDAEYTAAVDNGSYTNFVHDSAGYGLVQWTFWSRKQALYDYAIAAGASIGDLNMQLSFLWEEIQSYKSVMAVLNSAGSVRAACDAVLTGYEKPANQGEAEKQKRAAYGQECFDKYAGSGSASAAALPYLVRVSIPDLNIRTGPGTNYSKTGQYTGIGVFTIVEESDGEGAIKWGLLKSGSTKRNRWISLDFAEKVCS